MILLTAGTARDAAVHVFLTVVYNLTWKSLSCYLEMCSLAFFLRGISRQSSKPPLLPSTGIKESQVLHTVSIVITYSNIQLYCDILHQHAPIYKYISIRREDLWIKLSWKCLTSIFVQFFWMRGTVMEKKWVKSPHFYSLSQRESFCYNSDISSFPEKEKKSCIISLLHLTSPLVGV